MGILMEYIPPKGKKGKRLSVVLLVIACIGLIFAALLEIRYRLFYQLIALVVYIFSFELLNRYHLSSYCYTIDEKDFIITTLYAFWLCNLFDWLCRTSCC